MDVLARPAGALTRGAVTLRRCRGDDAGLVYELVAGSLEHLRPWMIWAEDYTPESAREYARGCEREWDAGTTFNYLISEDGVPCGSAGLMARIGAGGLEIGYWVARGHVGRGIATAAAGALTDAALGLPGIERTEIVHDLNNAASGRVPRKLGYARVGTEPGRFPRAPGECGTSAIWRLVRPAAG